MEKKEITTVEVEELEKRVSILENRLKNVRETLDEIIYGGFDSARRLLEKHKETPEFPVLEKVLLTILAQSTSAKTYSYLAIIVESMPFPFFIKDESGKYLLVNSLEARLFKLKPSEIIGKNDKDLIKDEKEIDDIAASDKEVLTKGKSIELPEQKFTIDGFKYIFKTHKVPFTNPLTGRTNILGFSIDVTDSVALQSLQNIMLINKNPFG